MVPRALLLGLGAFYALVDVAGLLVDSAQYPAGLGVKHVLALRVTDARNHIAGDGLHVQIRMAFYLAREDDLPSGHQRFTRDLGARIKRQKLVNQSIADLISNLIGMSF